MRRKNLLTQVLVANLLLIVAAVVVTGLAGNPDFDLGARPGLALILALAVGLTIIVNVFMLQRRFRPLERLVDEMERADLSRPGANLQAPPDARGESEEVERAQPRVSPNARASGGRAAPDVEHRASGSGGGASAGGTRPA